MPTRHYRPGTSSKPQTADTFREQMADFVRGQHLRALRDARHISREKVAAALGVTTKSLYSWEHGGKIKWENAKKLARYYAVDPEELVSRDGTVNIEGREMSQLDRIEQKLDQLLAAIAPGEVPAGIQPPPGELGRRATSSQPKTAPPERKRDRQAAGGSADTS